MGKYDAVMTGLQKLPPADATYQAKVDKFKETIENREATALAEGYVQLRAGSGIPYSEEDRDVLIADLGKEGLEALLYVVNLRILAYEQLLVESQDAEAPGWGEYGVKANALRLPSGDTIRIEREPSGKVVDKEQFRLWCIANGYERQLQLWPSTMIAMVKERLLKAEPLPDGCEAFGFDKVKFVAAKANE